MVKRIWVLALALAGLAGAAEAQQRSISGRVISALTSQPLAGARVSVVGTAVTAVTGDDGNFALAAPAGDVRLVARIIGYKRRQVTVPAGQSTVQIALDEDVFNLEAVVVTGQATAIEQRNLANAVATVRAEEIARAPTQTVETALQGKIPGALIQSNSGAPGGGVQVNLRGVSTIIGRATPLFVVDGIVVSDAAIPNGQNAVTASQAGGNPNNQDDAVNRIADLNPNDIERIEVLKGASAAAIYGTKATNGVIIVTTRRGRAGEPRFQISQKVGTFDLANKLGFRRFETLAEVLQVKTDTPTVTGLFQPNRTFDLEEFLYGRNDLSTETSASVSGGTEQTRYFVSGLVKNDAGIAPNTGYEKQTLRANLDQRLGDRVDLSVSASVTHSLSKRGVSNNDNAGVSPYLVFPLTPNFIDLRRLSLGDSFPDNPFERSNPLETFDLLTNDEDVWRTISSGTLRINAATGERHSLQLIGTGGLDYFVQRNDFVSPPELEFESADGLPGTVVSGRSTNANLSLGGHAVHTFRPASGAFLATTSAGIQWEQRSLNATSILGRNLLPGERNVDQATSINVAQDVQPVRDLGLFAQEEVLLAQERLLLTLGVRADRSSANGDTKKYHLFPKAAASYRFVQPGGGVEELKVRGAWGQTGNPPLFGAKFIPDTTGTIDGRLGTIAGQRIGDPSIEPERQTEIELGFDLAVRLPALGPSNLQVTWYQKTITDLLLEQQVAPSTGRLTRVFNGGELRNRGVEIALGATPVRTADVEWSARATFFANGTKIIDLPVPAFEAGGFGTALGAYKVEQGKSATQIVGFTGVDGSGTPIVSQIGDATPDFQVSFSSDVQYGPWSLGFLLDWKKGGDVINLTELLFDLFANTVDYETHGQFRADSLFNLAYTTPYVQDGSYLKLREVNLSYRLPESATAWLFGSRTHRARLSFTGRNLVRITDYRGLDPEVSNFGNQAIFRNFDVGPFPPNRSYWFGIDVEF